jgi:hypothetical protein
MVKTEEQLLKKELKRAVLRACRSVEQMIREEPHPIVISDGSSSDSGGTLTEITSWLFQRRYGDGSERNGNHN